MMNQVMRFDSLGIVGLLKMINGLDPEKRGSQKSELKIKWSGVFSFFASFFFVNLSQSMKDQRLKFEPLDIFGLIKRVYGSDLALEAPDDLRILRRWTAFSTCAMHYSNSTCIQWLMYFFKDISRSMLTPHLKFHHHSFK